MLPGSILDLKLFVSSVQDRAEMSVGRFGAYTAQLDDLVQRLKDRGSGDRRAPCAASVASCDRSGDLLLLFIVNLKY
jgi:hypothetical protein